MAQTIKLKRSSSAGAKPTFNQLALGEMAINTNDGALYIKRDNGTESIVTIHDEDTLHIDTTNTRVGIGNIAPTSTLDVTGTITAQNLTVSSSATIPYDNSVSGLTATTVQSAISELNNLVGGGNVGAQSTFNVYSFTSTASQTTFDLHTLGISPNPSYVAGYIQVFLNGILLDESDYTATDGQNIVLGSGASVNDVLNVIILDGFDIAELLRVTSIDASASTDSIAIDANDDVSLVGSLSFADNEKAIFGAGSDLQIYHDGFSSYIEESGAGSLLIRGDNTYLTNTAGNKSYIDCVADGEVILRHNNLNKLATTSTGIDVTGSVTADGLTVEATTPVIDVLAGVNEDASLRLRENGIGVVGAEFTYDGGDNELYLKVGNNTNTKRLSVSRDTGDISFYEDTGTDAKFFWDASAESLGIGTDSPDSKFVVSEGASATGLEINPLDASERIDIYGFDRGSNVYRDLRFIADEFRVETGTSSATERLRIDSSGRVGINTTTPDSNIAEGIDINGFVVSRYDFASGVPSAGLGGVFSVDANVTGFSSGDLVLQCRPGVNSRSIIFYTGNTSTERLRIDASGNATFAGDVTATRLRLTTASDASVSSTDHAFQIGSSAGTNIIIDDNEIMARNNGATSSLNFQADGGDIFIRNNNTGTTGIYMSGTQFMDQNRNLTNIGSISTTGVFSQTGPASISNNTAYFSTKAYGTGQGDNRTHFGYYNSSNGSYVNYIRGTSTFFSHGMTVQGDINISGDSRSITMLDGTTSSQPSIAIGEQSLYGFQQRWDSGSKVQFEGWWASSVSGATNRDFGSLDVNNLLWTFNTRVGINTDASTTYNLQVNGNTRFRSPAADQAQSEDSGSVPSTTVSEMFRLEGAYNDGTYTHEFAKIDRVGNLPLYLRESRGTANSFTNIVRFGSHANTGGGANRTNTLHVFGDMGSSGAVKAVNFLASSADSTPESVSFNNTLAAVAGSTNRVVFFDGNGGSPSTWYGNGNTAYAAIDVGSNSFNIWIRQSGVWNNIVDVSTAGLFVDGNITASGSISDIRKKENIEVIPEAMEKIKKLDGITFNYKKNGVKSTGLIAQQVMKVLPEVVYETEEIDHEYGEEPTEEKTYAINYGNIVGLLVEGLKEQDREIQELKKLVHTLLEK